MTKFNPDTMVKNLSDYPHENEALTFLLYGNTKTGKTHIAGTFGSRTFYINIGNGFSTLLSPKFKSIYTNLYPSDPIYNPIRVDLSGDDLYGQVISALDYAFDSSDSKGVKISTKFDTVVLDDISKFYDAAMDKAIDVNFSQGRSKVKAMGDIKIVGIQDFGTQMGIVDHFISNLTDSCKSEKKNLVVLGHEKNTYKNDKGNQILISTQPLFTGNNKITSYFDMVWNTSTMGAGEQVKYRARTMQTAIVEAGTRWGGVFPENYLDPNYPDILRRLNRI